MKKIIFTILALFLGFVVLSIAAWLKYFYPDDSRVKDLVAVSVDGATEEFVASVLKSDLPHTIDIEDDVYSELQSKIGLVSENNVITGSKRFHSKYQAFAPLGFYPWRLEAWDALAIPDGHTLSMVVPLHSELVEFTLRGGADSEVVVKASIGAEQRLKSEVWSQHTDLPESLNRAFLKYLYLDRYETIPRWQSGRMKVTPKDTLTFTCRSKDGWCFVGDPTFYKVVAGRQPKQTLLIVVDTLRGDAVQAAVMPELDAYASSSFRFTQALAPGNMTSPSTNALLACRTPTDLGKVAFAYSISPEDREEFYSERKSSFPAMLQKRGIRTAMIGNISVISEAYGVGVNHGFDQQLLTEPEGYETALSVSETLRWLEEHKNKDFFLYVHLNNPHAPYRPPVRHLLSQYRNRFDLTTYPALIKWLYRGEAAYTDAQLARIKSYLRASGLDAQINVLVTSDHGDQHEERSFFGNEISHDFSGVYFDHGATMLNDEIRVPLIVHRPGAVTAERPDYVSTLWIGKTVLGFFGEPTSSCVGADLLVGPTNPPTLIGSEGFQARAVLFDGRYKYIKSYNPTEKRVYTSQSFSGVKKSWLRDEQLFDLGTDPHEMQDLSRTNDVLLEKARAAFKTYFGITSQYELVLQANGKADYRISTGEHGEFEDLVRVKLTSFDGSTLPGVRINDQDVLPRVTTLKLPWPARKTFLPEESVEWLRSVGTPSATLINVREERRRDRRISLGNPAFEQVLREWGYLNEN